MNSSTAPASLDFSKLHQSHPELFRAPYNQNLPFQTLTSLGLSSSAQAVQSGYICVRPSYVAGNRAYPGLWLAPKDLPLLEAAYHVEMQRQQVSRQKAEQRSARAEELKERSAQACARERVLRELHKLTDFHETQLKKALPPEWLEALTSAARAGDRITPKLLEVSGVTWQGSRPDAQSGEFQCDGFIFIPQGHTFFQALIRSDTIKIDQELSRQWSCLLEKAETLERKWFPSRPKWFALEQLRLWCRAKASGSASFHPLQALLEKHHVREIWLIYQGRRVSFPFNKAVLDQLWQKSEYSGEKLLERLQQDLRAMFIVQIENTLAVFIRDMLPRLPLEAFGSKEAIQRELKEAYLSSMQGPFRPQKVAQAAVIRLERTVKNRQKTLHRQQLLEHCRNELPRELKDFYPLARSLGRRLTFIMGPTNSGKTHQALERLAAAETGVYLGPLRLLALEVHERLLEQGVPNSLVTGELILETPGARHKASTIEMLDLHNPVDVAVIDEVQMLADPDRGSAWLEAILGTPARHLILVGSATALPLVRSLAAHTAEPLELIELKRLASLEVLKEPASLTALQPGTALIVFSRKDALGLAAHLRERSGQPVAVIYGALSPEVRREQARQFREGQAPLLVATDAIGMGLNLPIRTLLFTTLHKWDGKKEARLDLALFKQIAGRAGRFGLHEKGVIGALDSTTLNHARELWQKALPPITGKLSIPPNRTIAHIIARHSKDQTLAGVLKFFSTQLTWHNWVRPVVSPEQFTMAGYLDHFAFSLDQKLTLLNAPAIHRNELNQYYLSMLRAIEAQASFPFPQATHPLPTDLERLEEQVRSATLYCWMHYRQPHVFPDIKGAHSYLSQLNSAITQELQRQAGRRCGECGRRLAWNHPFRICEPCYIEGRSHNDWY